MPTSQKIAATVIVQQSCNELGHFASVPDLDFVAISREKAINWRTVELRDVLIVLGSDWSLADSKLNANQESELRLVERCLQRSVPIFGVCYGAQALSKVLGSRVVTMEKPEIGWSDIVEAQSSAFLGQWLQWHYDNFFPPASSAVLAKNEYGYQAFQFDNCLGVQFHPEATTGILTMWLDAGGEDELDKLGLSGRGLGLLDEGTLTESEQQFHRLFEWFRLECIR